MVPKPHYHSLDAGSTVIVFGSGLHAKVVISEWYRDAFQDVPEPPTEMECAYIERASRGVEPLSAILVVSDQLRVDPSLLLVHDLGGAPLLVHVDEVLDLEARMFDAVCEQFRVTLDTVTAVSIKLNDIGRDLSAELRLVPNLAGVLIALTEKSGRLVALMNENSDFTDAQQLARRASFGKKIATEFAQEFAGFRFQLTQQRALHEKTLVRELGVPAPTAYHLQFGLTPEQQSTSDVLAVVKRLLKLTADLRVPVLDVAEEFENADTAVLMHATLTRLGAGPVSST